MMNAQQKLIMTVALIKILTTTAVVTITTTEEEVVVALAEEEVQRTQAVNQMEVEMMEVILIPATEIMQKSHARMTIS